MAEPTIYDLSSPGRIGFQFPKSDVPEAQLPAQLVRSDLPMPEISEFDAVRHFTRLSKLNYSIDSGFYPLGSCTMKYNPKINEVTARLTGFTKLHPHQPIETVQGSLALMYDLQQWLQEISGFAGVTLQPAAGAHGEYVGVMIIRAYHQDRGDTKRTKIIIPDSAHGTNPASSSMSGFDVVPVATDKNGNVELDSLRSVCNHEVAGLMLTNPNTLGLFEQNVQEVINIVHEAGGLVYGDGANLNALLGIVRPGDLGIDLMHFNLHKTFSTPHGGGGPGSGPVGVAKHLVDYLPCPVVGILEEATQEFPPFYGYVEPEKSIGRIKAFHGHFGMMVRAYTYISMYGKHGMRKIAEGAVLNANYLMALIKDTYKVTYPRMCMHEFVVEGHFSDAPGIHALDIAKRLMDYNYHPPTNYFPLIVPEALMIEPTETESKQTLDEFANALIKIAKEARDNPELLKDAPHYTPIGRLDEVKAAKDLVLCCWIPES
ncbi:MAG: glycine dehydrogenase (aminomethyl-transferring) [Chloroflexi bacterium HGW-Chloroflexi-10]|nr:MAG: glycine dehydrogenase (aminomethyl-transferring) [Chloroflexi bacterium HGW-Chloroflexi-10]